MVYDKIRGMTDFIYFAESLWGVTMGEIHKPLIKNLIAEENAVNQISRGCGKSECTIMFVLWKCLHNRNLEIGIVSATEKQSVRLLDKIKRYLKDIPELKSLRPEEYPEELEKWQQEWSKLKIRTSTNCCIQCMPFNPTIRGFRLDWIICDDILQDDISGTGLSDERAKMIFEQALEYAVTKGGLIKVVGTPMSGTDLLNTLSKRDDFLSYKQSVALLDETGAIVGSRFEYMYPLEKLLKKQRNTSTASFNREILLQPITNENSIFPVDDLLIPCIDSEIKQDVMMYNKNNVYYCGVDIALSRSNEADYTVITVISRDSENILRRCFIYRSRGDTSDKIKDMILFLDGVYHFAKIYVEKNALGFGIHRDLEMVDTLTGRYEGIHMSANYKFNIIGQLEVALRKREYLHAHDKIYFNEMSKTVLSVNRNSRIEEYAFMGKHDDTVISSAIALDAALSCKQPQLAFSAVKKTLFATA